MKNIPLAILLVLMTACAGKKQQNATDGESFIPAVMSDSMRITEDELNNFYYKIRLEPADTRGVYHIHVAYGPNTGSYTFRMPKGGEDLQPLIRRGDAPYSYIIGFKTEGDTTFHDYYLVQSSRLRTEVKPIKAYRLE